MREVARRAGVSHMTVSRVLRERGNVQPETRARVLRAVRELDYRVNPLVRAYAQHMRRGKGRDFKANLGWVGAGSSALGREATAWEKACKAAVFARAEEQGYSLSDLGRQHGEMKGAAFVRMLKARGIEGLILADFALPHGIGFSPQEFALVAIGEGAVSLPLHRVVPDYAQDMRMVFDRLLESGRERIGMYQYNQTLSAADEGIRAAFLREQFRLPEDARIPPRHGKPFEGDLPAATEPLLRWIDREEIDVLLVDQPELAADLRQAGLRIPEDLAIGDLGYGESGNPGLSGLRHRTETIGHVALDQLGALLMRNERGLPEVPMKIAIPAAWREGESLGEQRPASLKRKAAPLA
jgi:DNA-binding LacI/PurR family transcriptional regulator